MFSFPIIPRSSSQRQGSIPEWGRCTPLDAALYYAYEVNIPIFPLRPRGKEPLVANGFYQATTHVATIEKWWGEWPDAGIGIPTGQESGIVVLDIDAKPDPNTGKNGYDSLADFAFIYGYKPLPTTITARSGSGGRHYYFAYPPDVLHIKTLSRLANFAGVDVRGDGGYIVAPPTMHSCGIPYSWERWLDTAPLAVYPPFLLGLETLKPYGPEPPPPVPAGIGHYGRGRERASRQPAERWCQIACSIAMRRAHVGNRNALGAWLARQVVKEGLDVLAAEQVMREYARHVPAGDHPYTEDEALRTLKSISRRFSLGG
jgi:hypothetical protein